MHHVQCALLPTRNVGFVQQMAYHYVQCRRAGPTELQRLVLVVKNAEVPPHPLALSVRSDSFKFFSILVYRSLVLSLASPRASSLVSNIVSLHATTRLLTRSRFFKLHSNILQNAGYRVSK